MKEGASPDKAIVSKYQKLTLKQIDLTAQEQRDIEYLISEQEKTGSNDASIGPKNEMKKICKI